MTDEDMDGQMEAEQRLKERVRVLEEKVSGLVAIAEGEFELIKELKDAVAQIVEERERERGEL